MIYEVISRGFGFLDHYDDDLPTTPATVSDDKKHHIGYIHVYSISQTVKLDPQRHQHPAWTSDRT